jgi:hypothetical protein
MNAPVAGVATAVLAVVIGGAVLARAQAPATETFTGNASARKGTTRVSASFSLTITRHASDAERDALIAAIRSEGTAGARKALAAMPDAGVIQLGERRTAIKFASERATGSGRLVTVLTAQPLVFVGAGLPDAQPRAGYDVALAFLDLQQGSGKGELAPAAKVGVDDHGALVTHDYGSTVIWLDDLVRAK